MNIERINNYKDTRFSKKVLKQHGAFLIDNLFPCEIEIFNHDSAVVKTDYKDLDEVIDLFRFYSEHIIKFYDINKKLIKTFPEFNMFWIEIDKIQPSQFYVDKDKINALKEFIKEEADVIIPVAKINDQLVSLDGHTRLKIALEKKFQKVKCFYTEYHESINLFVKEAKKRLITSPSDIKVLSHEEYDKLWNDYCDQVFKLNK